MRLAILQPVADLHLGRCPYRDDVAALGAELARRGHEVTLNIVDTFDEPALAAAVAGARPEVVLLYVESLAADLAFRIAGALAVSQPAPLVTFGPHASLASDECLSMPGVEAVAVGPADLAVPPYLDSRRASLDYLRSPGLWVKCETGVMRNPAARPPESLADCPPPAPHLYPSDQVVDAAGFAAVRAARGGEGGRTAAEGAVPPAQAAWPPSAAWPVLHRPVDAVIDEMLKLADEQLDLGGFRIGNDRWASSPPWLAEFAEKCARCARMPIRTTLHAPDVTAEAASLLARAGCEEVRIQVGSGSALIRTDILGLNVTPEAAQAAFAALRRAGVRGVACAELGAPYETPASLEQTVEFLRRLDPDRVEATLHYPAPGTASHKAALENGWLVPDPAAAHLAGRPAVVLPRLAAEDLVTACEVLPYAIVRPAIASLIRLARRVKIGSRGTAYECLVKPFLAPPVRRR